MKRGLDWYKREPQPIRMAMMAAKMTTAQACVYSLVIDLIYEGGGETPNEPQHVAAHFSDMGTAKARRTIGELLDMGKLYLVGDMLHQERAENEAKTRQKLSKNCAESGKKGGISSGFSRRQAKEIKLVSEAVASRSLEAEIERESEEGGGVGARESDLLDRVLVAAKVDVSKDVTGKWFSSEARWTVDRWVALGLTDAEITAEIVGVMRGRQNPPGSLAYFNSVMQRAAGRKQAPALVPAIPAPPTEGAVHVRPSEPSPIQERIARAARRAAARP